MEHAGLDKVLSVQEVSFCIYQPAYSLVAGDEIQPLFLPTSAPLPGQLLVHGLSACFALRLCCAPHIGYWALVLSLCLSHKSEKNAQPTDIA